MKNEEISLKTKRALAEALKKKMKVKAFNKITVSELANDVNVNRKTFYYHFDDIYSLFKWMLEEEAINIVKHFDLLVDSEEALIFVMNYIEENNHIINCAYDSIGRDILHQFFISDFYEIVASIITNEEQKRNKYIDPNYKNFLIHFITNAISGALLNWIKNPDKRNRENTINYLTKTIKLILDSVLNDT